MLGGSKGRELKDFHAHVPNFEAQTHAEACVGFFLLSSGHFDDQGSYIWVVGKPDDAEVVALFFNVSKVLLGYVIEGDVLVHIIMSTQFFGL